jgi:hypothetical protein
MENLTRQGEVNKPKVAKINQTGHTKPEEVGVLPFLTYLKWKR